MTPALRAAPPRTPRPREHLPPAADYLTISETRELARRFFHIMGLHQGGEITGPDAAQRLQDLHHEAQRWAQSNA